MKHHQASLDETIIPAILSIIGSGTIILTYIVFRDLRRLRYIELVFYVAVNSLIAAIGTTAAPYHFFHSLILHVIL